MYITLLTTLENPKNSTHSHSLIPIQVASQFCSIYQVIVLLQARHPWPASQKNLKSHFLEVRKMFLLIQNKSYPPLLLLAHPSNEARNYKQNCREATCEKNFMDNSSNFCMFCLTAPST